MELSEKDKLYKFEFYWEDDLWLEYIAREDFESIVADLLEGMDEASHEYVQMHIRLLKLLPYKKHIRIDKDFGWTNTDLKSKAIAQRLTAVSHMEVNYAFMYANAYGMRDVPKKLFSAIDGKCIVDGGAYIGDTLLLFHTIFPQSRVFAFEPQKSAFNKLKKTIQLCSLIEKTVPLCRGLSNTEEELTLYTGKDIDSGATCNATAIYDKIPTETIKTTTIDAVFQTMNTPVGLIKLDIEGLEMKALEGAKQTIQRHKPVIVAAIYHRPQDFFELKHYIKSIHPEYTFMIRRSEMVLPTSDLVLIAY